MSTSNYHCIDVLKLGKTVYYILYIILQERIDDITVEEVLGRFPHVADKIDAHLEDYFWRPDELPSKAAH